MDNGAGTALFDEDGEDDIQGEGRRGFYSQVPDSISRHYTVFSHVWKRESTPTVRQLR